MKLTTLCYIENNQNEYLMLHRTKKKEDENQGKWIGIGGKFEDKESPHDCVLREVKEETGLTLTDVTFRGIITFVSNQWETEYMHLFTSNQYEGDVIECKEGDLAWIAKDEIMQLNLWEGDRIFLKRLLQSNQFFSMKLIYEGEKLVSWDIQETNG